MAIIRYIAPAIVAITMSVATTQVSYAKGPCDKTFAKKQLTMQMHQLEEQKERVNRQYRVEKNEAARRVALAQIDSQKAALEAQKRGLKEQKEECKEGIKHRK